MLKSLKIDSVSNFWLGVLVALPILYICYPMLGHEPMLDDPIQIAYIRGFDSVWDCFKPDSNQWFRPFKNFIFYLTYDDVVGVKWIKAASLGIFIVNVFLVVWVLHKFFESKALAFLGAALFAYNPTNISSIQFLSAVNNQLCLTFILAVLGLGLNYAKRTADSSGDEWPQALYFDTLLCLMLALVAYEAAIVAFALLGVVVIAKYGWKYGFSRHGIRLWGGAAALTFAYLILRLGAAKTVFISPSLPEGTTKIELILRAPYYAWTHFLLWAEPWGRGGVFLDDDPRDKLALGVIGWGILLGLAIWLIWALNSRLRFIAAGLLLFLVAMAPLANFFGLGNGPICNYYLLIPGFGLALATTAIGQLLFHARWSAVRIGSMLCFALLLLANARTLSTRLIAWRDATSLLELTVQNYPDNYHALAMLGVADVENGDHAAGQEKLAKSRELAPWALHGYLIASYGYRLEGDDDQARQVLESYESANLHLNWTIGERLAELALIRKDWKEIERLLPDLLNTPGHPNERCRFCVRVVIPYFIVAGRLDDARLMVEEVTSICSSSNEEEWRLLQGYRQILSER